MQHSALLGSHTALLINLHVLESQHVELTPLPGSQSSPLSTIPLPHMFSVMSCWLGLGFTRQVVFTAPLVVFCISEPRRVLSRGEGNKDTIVQMFPIEHWEKPVSPDDATGLIKNLAVASQVLLLSGQQELVLLHPLAHYEYKV